MKAPPLSIALSPYHLTTREAPAMAALLLADQVVTLLPTPAQGSSRADFGEAVERSPRYLRLVESWRWSGPLWRSGTVAGERGGEAPYSEFPAVVRAIDASQSLTSLRPLVKRLHALDPDQFLDALAADILKGGPDPSMSIPIAASIDRFASRRGYAVARAAPTSVAQRAEARTARRLFSIAVPVLLRAHGARIAEAREALRGPLIELRSALAAALAGAKSEEAPLRAAADRFAAEFRDHPTLLGSDDDDGVRVTWGWVSITGVAMPADCVLRSSRAAIRTMQTVGAGSAAPDSPQGTSAEADAGPVEVLSLIIREMTLTPGE